MPTLVSKTDIPLSRLLEADFFSGVFGNGRGRNPVSERNILHHGTLGDTDVNALINELYCEINEGSYERTLALFNGDQDLLPGRGLAAAVYDVLMALVIHHNSKPSRMNALTGCVKAFLVANTTGLMNFQHPLVISKVEMDVNDKQLIDLRWSLSDGAHITGKHGIHFHAMNSNMLLHQRRSMAHFDNTEYAIYLRHLSDFLGANNDKALASHNISDAHRLSTAQWSELAGAFWQYYFEAKSPTFADNREFCRQYIHNMFQAA